MPSVKNPGLLVPRAGQVPAKTVPSAGLIEPNRDVEPLKAHLSDPSRAHMASAIGIVDAGGFYASDEVEGALQEVGGGNAYGRQSGVLTGCTFTSVGTTLTIDAGSKILFKGMLRDVSGESVVVTAGTKYIYFDGTTGVLTSSGVLVADLTLGFVLVARVVSSGVAITSSIDLRFFVVSLDRKVDYTVRDGGLNQANNEAEACFVTLEAAFFWLNNFAPSVESKRTLIVRGDHTVTDTLTLSQNKVEIRGEGGATITFTSASQNLIHCTATDDVVFRDLTFLCDGSDPNVTAFATSVSTTNFLFERCKFTHSGVVRWYYGIYAIDLLGNQQRMVVRDCYFKVNQDYCAAIWIADAFECSFENVKIDGGGYWYGSTGIRLGSTFGASESRNRISNLHVDNLFYGVALSTTGVGTVLTGCYLKDVIYGVSIGYGCEETVVSDCEVDLDPSYGALSCVSIQSDRCLVQGSTFKTTFGTAYPPGFLVSGVKVDAADHTTLVNNKYVDFRCIASNSSVDGVFAINGVGLNISDSTFLNSSITVAGNATGASKDVVVSDNIFRSTTAELVSYAALRVWGTSGATISGNRLFLNATGVSGNGRDGIQVGGGSLSNLGGSLSTGYSMNVSVTNNSISAATLAHIQIAGDVRGFTVSDNSIDGFLSSATTMPGWSGINVLSTGSFMAGNILSPSNGTVNGNIVRRCKDGILIEGNTNLRIRGLTMTGNSVAECVKCTDGSDNFDDKGCKGIGLNFVSDSVVSSNTVRDIGIIRNNSGVVTQPATDAVFGIGIYLRDCARVNVTANTVTDVYAYNNLVPLRLGLYRGIFWQIAEAALSPAIENDGMFITDNILTVTPTYPTLTQNPPNLGSSGISVVIEPASGDAIWYSACLEGNEIHSGLKSPSPYANPYGIFVSIQGAASALDVQDFSASNNTVSGFLYCGLIFDMSGASGNARTVRVKNNSVKHTTAAGSENSIQFVSNCSLLDLSIDSNDVTPDSTGNEAFAGIDVSLTASGTLRRVSVSDNQIQTCDRAVLLNVPSATLADFKVVGNEVAMTSPTTTGTEAIYLIGDNADGLNVDRNSVTYTSALAQDDTTAILVTLDSLSAVNDNISICGNSVFGTLGLLGGTTGFVGIGFSPNNDVNNGAINDNSIRMSSTNPASDTMKHGIVMYLTDTTTAGAVLWYLSVCGNKISDANTSTGQATATATVAATPSTATLTIGGQALTPAAGPRTSGSNNYNNTLGTVALIRADIVDAINDPLNGFAAIATAYDGTGGVLNLTAMPFGSLGNAVTLASSTGTITVSGATFTGGSTVPHGALVLHGDANAAREAWIRTLTFSHNKIDGTANALTGAIITSSSSGNWTLIGNSSLFFGPATTGLLQGCFTSKINNVVSPSTSYSLADSTCIGNISGDSPGSSVTGTCDNVGNTINTLVDTGSGWTVNAYAGGRYWVTITDGPGVTQSRLILSNTATTLTVSPSWLVIPTFSTYTIQERRGFQGLGVNVTPFPLLDFNVDT